MKSRRDFSARIVHCFRQSVVVWACGTLASVVCGPIAPLWASPSLSGAVTLFFTFSPDDPNQPGDQSFWSFSGHSGAITLTLPSVLDISAVPGPGTLSWADPANWTTFPLDTSGLSLSASGSGSFTATVNNGSPNLDVLGGFGPWEYQTQTNIFFGNITPSGAGPCPDCVFGVNSNTVNTKYNVTLPAGAHLNNNQANVNVQSLTVNSGAAMLNALNAIRGNLTNHGSGNFGGTVEGNFINDALAAGGNVANASGLTLQGQLLNTGELYIPSYLATVSATSNSGAMFLNGGQFRPQAAFANNGSFQFSSGSLFGPGTVTNNGSFQWTGGSVEGSAGTAASIINASNTFTISGTDSKIVFGSLTNSGTITQSGGSTLALSFQTTLMNQAGALYDVADDSGLENGTQGGTFGNAGTFRKSGGSGTSTVGSAFTNTGAIQVNAGTLKFTGGGTFGGGSISFAAGTVAQVAGGGDFSVSGANTASGNGTLKITSGHVYVATGNSGSFANFTGGAKIVVDGGILEAKSGGTLTLNLTGASSVQLTGSGTVGGAGMTINNGNFAASGGQINGNLTNNSANFNLTTGNVELIGGGTLANNGTITQSGGGQLQIGGSTLANQAGALYDLQDDSGIRTVFQAGLVTNAGTLRKSGGTGTSVIDVPLTNTGRIAINTGTLQINSGPFALTPSSTLEFTLAGVTPALDFGKLDVIGGLTTAGKLAVSLAPSFSPTLGESFDVLDFGSVSDGFSSLQLPLLASGLKWDTSALYTSGVLSVGQTVPGDYNQDGLVDAADYTMWRDALGSTTKLYADGNHNNVIDAGDYDVWKTNFGAHAGSGATAGLPSGATGSASASAAVPEPRTFALWLAGCLVLCVSRRR